MITQDNLKKIGLDEEKSKQVIDILGDASSKLYHEDGYKKAKDEDDLSFLTVTKIAKKDDERSSDYHKRAVQEYANSLVMAKESELTSQITDLNEKLKAKPGDEKLVKELHELKEEKKKFQEIVDAKVKEKEDELIRVKSEYDNEKKGWALSSSVPTNLIGEADYISFKRKQALEKAMKEYDVVEEENGETVLKNSRTYSKMLAKDFFSKELEPIIDKGNNQGGGGAGKGIVPPKNNGELKLDENMSEHEKVVAIREYLTTQKAIPIYDSRYTQEMNKIFKENKLDHLMTEKELK